MKYLGINKGVYDSLKSGSRKTLYKERRKGSGEGRKRGGSWMEGRRERDVRKGRRREGEIAEHMIKLMCQNSNNC